MMARRSTRSIDEGSFVEIKKLFAKEIITGFARIDGRAVGIVANQPKWQGRRALRRLGRQGGALHLAVRRVQHPAALPRRRARLHDRHQGRAAGDHPRRREDDRGGQRGDRAEALASSCARPTARGSTRCAARRSSPTRASRCRTASIAVMGPQAAVNAVYYNKIQEVPEGPSATRYVAAAARRVPRRHRPLEARRELVIDAVVPRRAAARRDRDALRAVRRQARGAAREKAPRAAGLRCARAARRSRSRRASRRRSSSRAVVGR